MPRHRIDLPLGGGFNDGSQEGAERPEETPERDFFHEPVELPEPEIGELPLVQPEAERQLSSSFAQRGHVRVANTDSSQGHASYVGTVHEPRHGLYGLLWKALGRFLFNKFGWKWLLRYSKRDRLQNALDDLWELRLVRKVIAFENSGGGSGKTTGCSWFSAAASAAFKGNVACIDANENAGYLANRFRIAAKPEESQTDVTLSDNVFHPEGYQVLNGNGTIRLREFVNRRHQFTGNGGHKLFLAEVDRHRESGVFVIASNAVDDLDIDLRDFEESLEILKAKWQMVFVDCGNGLKSPTNHGAVHVADELMFVGNRFKQETFAALSSTMERYENLGYAEKVKRGFVVIFGDSPRKRKKYAKQYGVPPEYVIIFPVNRYMRNTKSEVSFEKLPLRMKVILFEGLRDVVAA